jgi:hypothetical protein
VAFPNVWKIGGLKMQVKIKFTHSDVIEAVVEAAKRDCPEGYDPTSAVPYVSVHHDRITGDFVTITVTFQKEKEWVVAEKPPLGDRVVKTSDRDVEMVQAVQDHLLNK